MVNNTQMMSKTEINIVVSEKDFENSLNSVSKIASTGKNTGKTVLFRKLSDKLIICAGGAHESIAVVPVQVQGDMDECKGFLDGKDVLSQLSRSRGNSGNLQIIFNLEKSCVILKNDTGTMTTAFDIIKDVAIAESADDTIAKYKNEIVEKTYRIVRDVESLGKVQLSRKDFMDLEKVLKNTAYEINGMKYIDFRAFKEIQDVKTEVEGPNNTKKEVIVKEEFAIIEGIGISDSNMGISRKYLEGIKIPDGRDSIRILMLCELLSYVSSAMSTMNDDTIIISRGQNEMCISVGGAKFVCPIEDLVIVNKRELFEHPVKWKINIDAVQLKDAVEFISHKLDPMSALGTMPVPNDMIVYPIQKRIKFEGVGSEGFPIERYVSYEMATNDNGQVFKDFNEEQVSMKLQRSHLKEFLKACKGTKKVSFGCHVYKGIRNKLDSKKMYILDANGDNVKEEYIGSLISMEDGEKGIYGVHHRVEIE